jgi:hypothetical protein
MLILSYSSAAHAVEVTLAWDPPATGTVDGYYAFYRLAGQSYDYSQPTWQGTATTCTLSNLQDATTYFVVRAYNSSGESADSNEAMYQPASSTSAISQNTSSLFALCTQGSNASSQTFQVSNSGGGTLSYTISDDATWLSCGPTSGTSTGASNTITVSYATSGLSAGTYSATITIAATGASNTPQTISVSLNVVASDLPPAKPVITSPYNGQVECDPLLTIQTQPFSDPDTGDSHSKSRWQISTADDFASLVLDISTTTRLTALPVPHSVLDRNTTYFVRVQFFDAVGAASDWSDAVELRTISAIVDADQNGVPDSREVDNTVDLNGDGIPDNNQPDLIKDAKTALGNNVTVGICKASNSIVAIETLDTINPATILDKTNRPSNLMYGLVTYRLRVNAPGSTATVTLYFSSDISNAQGFYVYDTVKGWQNYTQRATFNTDGRSVTLELQDGGFGDSDGVANGVIVDPGGVVAIASGGTSTANSSGGSGGGGGGCFIATATSESSGQRRALMLILGILMCVAFFGYLTRIKRISEARKSIISARAFVDDADRKTAERGKGCRGALQLWWIKR